MKWEEKYTKQNECAQWNNRRNGKFILESKVLFFLTVAYCFRLENN